MHTKFKNQRFIYTEKREPKNPSSLDESYRLWTVDDYSKQKY